MKSSTTQCLICGGRKWPNKNTTTLKGLFKKCLVSLKRAPPPDVRSLTWQKKKKNSKKQKAVFFEDSDKVSSDNKKPPSKKILCQYHEKWSHSTDKYATLKALIKNAKSNKSKGYRKGGEKTCTKHQVNVLIEKKLKKACKGWKKRKLE